MLQALGAWETAAATAQPITAMRITDSRVGDPVRPVFLTFDGEVEPGEPFAHMVEHAALLEGLHARARAAGVALLATEVASATADADGTAATLADGSAVEARLVVACDGGRPPLREAAGIGPGTGPHAPTRTLATTPHPPAPHRRGRQAFPSARRSPTPSPCAPTFA
ncbi:FAD-dependent monooxygenase, partial [Nostoc sp. NIES-2111]